MDKPKTYDDKQFLDKTINYINRAEESSDYVLDYYIDLNGEVPTMAYLRKQRAMMENWLHKSKILLDHLKTAISHLNMISIDVYLVDYRR